LITARLGAFLIVPEKWVSSGMGWAGVSGVRESKVGRDLVKLFAELDEVDGK
jgi:hypothetical protein